MFTVFCTTLLHGVEPKRNMGRGTAVYSRVAYLEHRAAANPSQEIPSRFLISSSRICLSCSSRLARLCSQTGSSRFILTRSAWCFATSYAHVCLVATWYPKLITESMLYPTQHAKRKGNNAERQRAGKPSVTIYR